MNKQLKEDISCYFNLESNEPRIFSGDKSFEEMQVMLKEQGIELTILPDAKVLYLKFDHEKYNRTKTRHAGQQRKYAYKNEKKYEINAYKYYDILYFRFCKHWTWTKIADYIELSEATFFRHKKEMESSSEYKKFLESFDASDAESREYFKNFEELNYMF